MQNDVEHDSREELLRHENLVIRVVQNDCYTGQSLESW